MDLKNTWKSVLGELELQISKPNFQTWLKNSQLLEQKNNIIVVGLESTFAKEWVSNKYHKIILKIIRNFNPEIKNIEYQIVKGVEKEKKISLGIKRKQEKSFDLPKLIEFNKNSIDPKTGLSSKYSLESFVVGSNNELAYSAALAIIDNLGGKYNPLFIYGGVGLGKTHLIQAVGNKLKEVYKNKLKIKYVSTEDFVNDIVGGIRFSKTKEMKEKYRKIDVLIIDDIQFISGKEKTQEEFFNTFNALYLANKQIIISSDRSPYLLSRLEERLRSRFEGGMVVDITFPNIETRIAILKNKLESQNIDIELSNEILNEIAQRFPHNVRELEGGLSRIIGILNIRKMKPNIENIKGILDEITAHRIKMISADRIIKKLAEFYNISEKELLSHSRRKELVRPRQIVMYLLREDLKNSFPTIAKKLGNRDHTTILYAYNKISKDILRDKVLVQEINLIKEKIYSNSK
jgi:chromosomal replication initiator protein